MSAATDVLAGGPNAASGFDYEAALAACARGDRQALKRIYDVEARRLVGVALRIVRRRELANEVVHDAFLQIWQKAGTFDPSLGSGRGWIYTVVRHRALSSIRNAARELQPENGALEAIADCAEDPLTALARISNESALRRCLEALDDAKRTSIMLAFIDGYSHQQVAERLSTPLGTVKAWIRRGLLALKECLG
jgi:RNA polymerase sigma-70 factor (ECF subfamily)